MDLVIMGLHAPEQIAMAIAYSPQFQQAIRQGIAKASQIQPGVIGLGAEQVIRQAIVDAIILGADWSGTNCRRPCEEINY
jgi:hypothetical protein